MCGVRPLIPTNDAERLLVAEDGSGNEFWVKSDDWVKSAGSKSPAEGA